MRRCILPFCLAAALLAAAAAARAGQARARTPGTPEVRRAVSEFYRRHFATDMGFTEKSLRSKRRSLTPELYSLLLYERRRPVPEGDVPYMDGDPFTDSQDSPNRFTVGSVKRTGSEATVPVVFQWLDHGRVTDRRTCRLTMRKQHGAWLVADIVAPGGRSLLAELKALKHKDRAKR